MEKVKLAFSDQWGQFNPHDNFWLDQWRRFAEVDVVENMADANVLMYSDWGQAHWAFQGPKIYCTGENMLPDFEECDLAFSNVHLPNEPRNVRLPIYVFYTQTPIDLIKGSEYNPEQVLAEKSKFCNFVVSNPRCPTRNKAFKLLNRRKRVDSGGKLFNNLGYRVADKIDFLRQYKFTLAFENSSSSGYTTEKLLEPMVANSLPIYWGNPDVAQDFNTDSFIVAERFPSLNALFDYIIEVDRDDTLYLNHLSQPWLPNNQLTEVFSIDRVRDALMNFWQQKNHRMGPRQCRKRYLWEHKFDTTLARKWEHFKCRLDSAMWKATHKKPR